jgi:hypothetical protein
VPIGHKPGDPDVPALPLVTDLGYADVSLCSSTPEGLQSLINCFCSCCTDGQPHGIIGGSVWQDQPGLVTPAQLDPSFSWRLPHCPGWGLCCTAAWTSMLLWGMGSAGWLRPSLGSTAA